MDADNAKPGIRDSGCYDYEECPAGTLDALRQLLFYADSVWDEEEPPQCQAARRILNAAGEGD